MKDIIWVILVSIFLFAFGIFGKYLIISGVIEALDFRFTFILGIFSGMGLMLIAKNLRK